MSVNATKLFKISSPEFGGKQEMLFSIVLRLYLEWQDADWLNDCGVT